MTIVIKRVNYLHDSFGYPMRVTRQKAARNHEAIVAAASRLFREHGIAATGVDSITAQAGLTHGGLYSQFGSKEAIAEAAIHAAFASSVRRWARADDRSGKAFRAIVKTYLTPAHRDAPGKGCVVAALASEIARGPQSLRKAFTEELKTTTEFLVRSLPRSRSMRARDSAIAAFSCMVGALILSRAVYDSKFSDEILGAAARRISLLAGDRSTNV